MEFPEKPCDACLWQFKGEQGKAIYAYCCHNNSGSLKLWLLGEPMPWRSYHPISYEQFMVIVNETLDFHKKLIELHDDAEKALDQALAEMPEEKLIQT